MSSNVVTIAVPMSESAESVLAKLKKQGYDISESSTFVAYVSTDFAGRQKVDITAEATENIRKSMPSPRRA